MVRDLPFIVDHIPNYHICQFGKQNRWPVPNSTWKVSQELQLIHRDVSGPQKTPQLHDSLYYILSTDDFTRMCWIFFLKFKSEVARVFCKFKKLVENQSALIYKL